MPKFYSNSGGPHGKTEITEAEFVQQVANWADNDELEMVKHLIEVCDSAGIDTGEEGAEWFLFTLGGKDFAWNPEDGWDGDPTDQLALMVRGYRRADEEFAKQAEDLETVAKAMDMLADLIYSAAVGLETSDGEDRTLVMQEFLDVAYPFLEKLGVLERCKERFEKRSQEVADGKPA
jgi:hypothetical protein